MKVPDHEPRTGTLGHLLYADRSKRRLSEDHWSGLVRSIAERDAQALHALYQDAHRLVFTLVFRITRDTATAEELTVDVFHDVWRRAAAYDPAGGPVLGWILNQARSRAIDRLRFDGRAKRTPQEEPGAETPTTGADPADMLDDRRRGDVLRKAVEALEPAERAVIETAYFGELTYREVAERLESPLGTVKTRARSGLAKLRRMLDEGEG